MANFQILGVIFIYLAISSSCATITGSDKVSLVNDMYLLSWSLDDAANTITFTCDVGTTGWIGMGFSTGGKMTNSDMYMGYIDGSGKVIFDDYYNKSKDLAPSLDTSFGGASNISNVSGTEASGRTKITEFILCNMQLVFVSCFWLEKILFYIIIIIILTYYSN